MNFRRKYNNLQDVGIIIAKTLLSNNPIPKASIYFHILTFARYSTTIKYARHLPLLRIWRKLVYKVFFFLFLGLLTNFKSKPQSILILYYVINCCCPSRGRGSSFILFVFLFHFLLLCKLIICVFGTGLTKGAEWKSLNYGNAFVIVGNQRKSRK